ncbi:hypothetical protein NPIL_701431 [Nephila pilipes]|uniref:Uncharacterized protein n=1 Tax=Nephila pilipes TaxID=299642 RepID=A0A8X6IFT4_NEPPI|nr:hypothetical protein NPIL_701431 [Nephila pilipes]
MLGQTKNKTRRSEHLPPLAMVPILKLGRVQPMLLPKIAIGTIKRHAATWRLFAINSNSETAGGEKAGMKKDRSAGSGDAEGEVEEVEEELNSALQLHGTSNIKREDGQ